MKCLLIYIMLVKIAAQLSSLESLTGLTLEELLLPLLAG